MKSKPAKLPRTDVAAVKYLNLAEIDTMKKHTNQIEVQFESNNGAVENIPIEHREPEAKGPGWAERLTTVLRAEHMKEVRFADAAGREMMDCIGVCAGKHVSGVEREDVVQQTAIWLTTNLEELIHEFGIEALALKVWGKVRSVIRANRRAGKREEAPPEDGDLLRLAVDPSRVICQEHPMLGKNAELKAVLARDARDGAVLGRIVELIEQGCRTRELVRELKIDHKLFYRRYRLALARAWNQLNPVEARKLPPTNR